MAGVGFVAEGAGEGAQCRAGGLGLEKSSCAQLLGFVAAGGKSGKNNSFVHHTFGAGFVKPRYCRRRKLSDPECDVGVAEKNIPEPSSLMDFG